MANDEENKLGNDDLDDLDFDFEAPDTEIGLEGDSRKPVRKLTTSFAAGVKDDLTDRRDLTRKVRNVMPESYSAGIDLADQTLGTAADLYNTIGRETRQGVRDLKKATQKTLSPHREKLPGWLNKALDKALKIDETTGPQSESQRREEEISGSLGKIFELQMQQSEEQRQESEGRETVREEASQKRHTSLVSNLLAMRQDLRRQVTYQDQVTARYQRKSLELQYRHYYATRDMLAIAEKSAKDNKEALQAIVKNTALPEYRKIEFSEAGGQLFRDKMIEGLSSNLTGMGRNFIRNASQNLSERVRDKGRSINEQLSMIAGGMEMAADNADVLDPYETVGGMAGSTAARLGLDRLSPRLRRMLENNPAVAKQGMRFNRFAMDLPRRINEWAKEDHGPGILGSLANFLSESVQFE